MADLPGARSERFTPEETDVLVRAVKDREMSLNGDGRNPPKIASSAPNPMHQLSNPKLLRKKTLASGPASTGKLWEPRGPLNQDAVAAAPAA
ncbi:unnamed protein product [Boreogadus saida]